MIRIVFSILNYSNYNNKKLFLIFCIFTTFFVQMYNDAVFAQFTPSRSGILALRATFGVKGSEITENLVWRVYALKDSDAQLLFQSDLPRPSFALPAGRYAVHVSFGLATGIKEIDLGGNASFLSIPINAGGLIVSGYLGVIEKPIASNSQKLSLFIPSANNSEDKLVTNDLKTMTRLNLPEGLYHLVSNYGESNSVIRTNIKIETGKLTEAVVNHRAAGMTLKLVRQKGGVALADTEWTIETPGGDIVTAASGAFPTVDIAEGTYIITARHKDREYRGEMRVEGGMNRDFEVVME